MNFNDFNLSELLLKAISDEGYTTPSPIQVEAIPPILEGRDLLGCAQTGTGKTAAFALPILENLLKNPSPKNTKRIIRALILTPTRELAMQIAESFKAYGRHTNIKCAVVFGGVSAKSQIEELRKGIDILVATPGRLNDLHNQNEVDVGDIHTFVLDEADRMLDMGFVHDVRKIITWLPKTRQTLFFSATMPNEITKLISEILKNPVKVEVTPVSSTVDIIEQSVYYVDKANKQKLLIHLLQNKAIVSALVFTRTKHGANKLVKDLDLAGVLAQAIHGNKSQGARQLALENFKTGKTRVLVATDIAARGIDIDELSHVFNYDLPNIPETYVHRIGRTGRAGLGGIAISFCNFDEKAFLDDIIKLIGKNIPVVPDHPFPMKVFIADPKEENQRGHSRPSNKIKLDGTPATKTSSHRQSATSRAGSSSRTGASSRTGSPSQKTNPYSSFGGKRSSRPPQSSSKSKKGFVKKG